VSTQFQALLTPLPGCFFTFPSRYFCTIGRRRYLALEGGPPSFPRDSSCPVVLKNAGQEGLLPLHTRLSLSVAALSRVLLLREGLLTSRPDHGWACRPLTTPRGHWPVSRYLPPGFRLFPVRSPLLRE